MITKKKKEKCHEKAIVMNSGVTRNGDTNPSPFLVQAHSVGWGQYTILWLKYHLMLKTAKFMSLVLSSP